MSETAAPPENQFVIQKIYLKDASFESPSSPESFRFEKWEPQVSMNLNSSNKRITDDQFEAVLKLTVSVENEQKTAFLVEIEQGGVFLIKGFNSADLGYMLGSQCMNVLYPYAREVISEMVVKGGFPPFYLQPMNFDAVYAQHLQKQQQAEEEPKH